MYIFKVCRSYRNYIKFYTLHLSNSFHLRLKLPNDLPMKGLRRNDDAMKTDVGIITINFNQLKRSKNHFFVLSRSNSVQHRCVTHLYFITQLSDPATATYPPERQVLPFLVRLCMPFSTVIFPFTSTYLKPREYWCGLLKVDISCTSLSLNTSISAA